MKFLADECCSPVIIEALQRAGHDVVSVREVMRGAEDEVVLKTAQREKRILVTEDKDFGDLVVYMGRLSHGVVLIRSKARAYKETANLLCRLIARSPKKVAGHFVVVTPRHARSQLLKGG
jgi:predicted nuclease of predicted toxin-antitoxin system